MVRVADSMRILVTGGAGFLGSNLCDRLLRDEASVICLDTFVTGSRRNVAHLAGNENFEVIQHDVTIPIYRDVDRIYNLACPASPVHYQHDPLQTIKSNVHGAINMLAIAKANGATILQASTSEIYGDPEEHPQSEQYRGSVNPIGPRACYDEGKRCAEALFFDHRRQHGLAIKVARIFNTYGPRMLPNDGRVVSNLIVQALRNEPLTIYGSGEQTRSFCYVDDLIEGLIKLMESPVDFTGPVNMGSATEVTIAQLAEEILDITGSRSPIRLLRAAIDDPRRRRPDIRLARSRLGWEPQTPLRVGLGKTVEYFDGILRRRQGSLEAVASDVQALSE